MSSSTNRASAASPIRPDYPTARKATFPCALSRQPLALQPKRHRSRVGLNWRSCEARRTTRQESSIPRRDLAHGSCSCIARGCVGERLRRLALPRVEVGQDVLGVEGDERHRSCDDNALVTVRLSWPSRFSDGARRHAVFFAATATVSSFSQMRATRRSQCTSTCEKAATRRNSG